MRKSGTARKRPAGGITWDEHNLQENEAIKATISKTKIDEPKTPYHGPLGDQHMEEADDGLQPLELDGNHHQHPEPLESCSMGDARNGPSAGAGTTSSGAPEAAVQEAAAGDANGRGAVQTAPGGTSADHKQDKHGHSLHAHFESPLPSADAAPEPEGRSGFSSDSDRRVSLTGGSDTESNDEEARRKFEQRRKAHYNMRAALHRARLLLSEDGEGDQGQDGDGDGDGSSPRTANTADSDVAMDDTGKRVGEAAVSL